MRMTTYLGHKYTSKKHPVLEYIFKKYYRPGSTQDIHFSLEDISEGYTYCQNTDPKSKIKEPASISNTILDLTRKKKPISSRLPPSIYELGYDLCKRTGKNDKDKSSYAGTFVYVGVGNVLDAWLTWPSNPRRVIVDSNMIPDSVKSYLRNDEGALFSVIDYCNILSQAFPQFGTILRVQNPMKWQPNEIDGFYMSTVNGLEHLLPVEAKALTTSDDINLIQFAGGVNTIIEKLNFSNNTVVNPIAAQMVKNGIYIGLFEPEHSFINSYTPELVDMVEISFNPPLQAWC